MVTMRITPLTGQLLDAETRKVIKAINAKGVHGLTGKEYVRMTYPSLPVDRQKWWKKQVQRCVAHSRALYNKGIDGWAFITHEGPRYFILKEVRGGRGVPIAEPAVTDRVAEAANREWRTRTTTRMRSYSTDGQTLVREGTRKGDAAMVARGNQILDDISILSPMLAAIDDGLGEVSEWVAPGAITDPRLLKLIGKEVAQVRDNANRTRRSVRAAANKVSRFHAISTLGSLPPGSLSAPSVIIARIPGSSKP